MYIISVLCLRSPDHASRAIEAGAGDLAIRTMQKFPAAEKRLFNDTQFLWSETLKIGKHKTLLETFHVSLYF